ncbi:hypothetical protein BP6252_02983 [Coleophoma cylindrospora]|uniref:Heterokaryon incompatibility domain-containing protein n=1 Tax=Coleophoma cylindrospora TaxID=1849047 RepID=A0A3D8S723_9HELO|nr:hypothetical protein BP6252_02983 [Coleophoma cylindrospora]
MPDTTAIPPESSSSSQTWGGSIQHRYDSCPLVGSSTLIRVLDLDAAPSSNANPNHRNVISGRLRVVDLNDAPTFTALSYTWGDYSEPVKDMIECNGYPLEVTRNCWSALWHLRKAHGAITIWIDAICINQGNGEEKKGQIALMGTIFPSAQLVYIWLGEGSKKTDRAMDYLAQGGLPFSFLITRRVGGRIPTGNSMAFRFAIHILLCLLTFRLRPHYAALDEILSRPWVKRLWTLQEALLSNHAVIVCGEKSISWVTMVYAVDYMDFWRCTDTGPEFPTSFHDWRRLMLLWRKLPVDKMRRPGNHVFVDKKTVELQLAEHRRYLKRGATCHEFMYDYGLLALELLLMALALLNSILPGWIPLPERVAVWALVLLTSVRMMGQFFHMSHFNTAKRFHSVVPFKESDSVMVEIQSRKSVQPEDKYYGIIGIIGTPQTTRLLEEISLQHSLGDVYRALFGNIVEYTQSLDILLFTSSAKLDNCPSWVVDWRSDNQPWVKALYWYDKREPSFLHSLKDTTGLRKYSGAAPWPSLTCEIQWPHQLLVHGVVIGRLDWASERFHEISSTSSHEHLLQSVTAFHTAWSGFEAENMEATMRDISRFVGTCDGEPESESNRNEWVKVMHQAGNRHDAALENLMAYTAHTPRFLKSLMLKPWAYHMWMINFFASADMVLVRCSGIYCGFGVAPMGSQEGDIVALVAGVSMPMVLRQNGEGYTVVGPAFLRGTLDGQLWRSSPPRQLVPLVLI